MGGRSSAGDISYELTGLLHNTTYYVRSFAQNAAGLVYGDEISFTTLDGQLPNGTGTIEDPYKISSLSNLLWLSNAKEWDKHYIQTSDIDASTATTWNEGKGFMPIGNTSMAFTGSYNGDFTNITGFFIYRNQESDVGMFGVANGSASFSNITFISANVRGGSANTGILVGSLTDGSINNCRTAGTVRGSTYVGGMVGYNVNSTIEGSINSALVTCSLYYGGGLAGQSSGSSVIENCKNTVKIYSAGASSLRLGGIVGRNYSIIRICENSGVVQGARSVGGIAGENYGLIDKCENSGTVISGTYNNSVGGIAGLLSGASATVSRSFNTGNVNTGYMTQKVGGLVGSQYGGFFHR